ncbi:hypothetical protein [Mycolicibacterium sp.]|uniref:hypothetical protein n=1 Tax=Mycolicibacterium sp. TaxID=2320850 RepID=UPI0037C6F719
MIEEPPYPRLGDAQTDVVRALFDSLPGGAWVSGTVDSFPRGGWVSCTVEYRQVGRVGESRVSLVGSGGATMVVRSPAPMIAALKRLHELMAGEGRGPWVSVTVTAAPDGKCSFEYNYDVDELPDRGSS